MSDILEKQIARAMQGEKIDLEGAMTEQEVRDAYNVALYNISRLSAALDILFPGELRVAEGSIDCAIRLLEHASWQYQVNRR